MIEKNYGKAVATSLKQLDLRRRGDLFIWLGNYAHVRVMLGSSVNSLNLIYLAHTESVLMIDRLFHHYGRAVKVLR